MIIDHVEIHGFKMKSVRGPRLDIRLLESECRQPTTKFFSIDPEISYLRNEPRDGQITLIRWFQNEMNKSQLATTGFIQLAGTVDRDPAWMNPDRCLGFYCAIPDPKVVALIQGAGPAAYGRGVIGDQSLEEDQLTSHAKNILERDA